MTLHSELYRNLGYTAIVGTEFCQKLRTPCTYSVYVYIFFKIPLYFLKNTVRFSLLTSHCRNDASKSPYNLFFLSRCVLECTAGCHCSKRVTMKFFFSVWVCFFNVWACSQSWQAGVVFVRRFDVIGSLLKLQKHCHLKAEKTRSRSFQIKKHSFSPHVTRWSRLPMDQIPLSWAWSPCGTSPRRPDRGYWSRCSGEEGGRAWLGPAGRKAKAGCPSPTPQGPPRPLSDHGTEA